MLPNVLAIEGIIHPLPIAIIQVKRNKRVMEYLACWEDKEIVPATWVRGSWLHKYFLNAITDLEDKVALEGEGIVTNKVCVIECTC